MAKKKKMKQHTGKRVNGNAKSARPEKSPEKKLFFQTKKEEIGVLIIILLLSIGVRIIYFHDIPNSIFYNHYDLDSKVIDLWAQEISHGDFWGSKAFFRAPLYPYVVAFLYKTWGTNPAPVIRFQMFLGILTVFFIYFYARYLFSIRTAQISGLIAACWPTLLFFEGELMITTLAVFLSLLALIAIHLAIDRGHRVLLFCAGLLLGLAAITRPTILPTALLPLLYFRLVRKQRDWRFIGKNTAVYLLGAAVIILPVTVRNYLVADDLVLISTQAGANFYIGNSRYADGSTVVMPSAGPIFKDKYEDSIYSQSVSFAGNKLNKADIKDSEVSGFWIKKAFGEISGNPARFVQLFLKKAWLFWHGQEIFNNKNLYFAHNYSPIMRLLLWKKGLNFPSGILFALMIAGIYFCFKEKRNTMIPLLFIALFWLTISLFFVCARFRQPIIPVSIIFAAFGAHRLFLLFQRHEKNSFVPVGLFVFSMIFLNIGGNVNSRKNRSQFQNLVGAAYLQKNQPDQAIPYLEKALKIAPNNPSAIRSLTYAYIQAERLKDAERMLIAGIKREPRSAQLINNLAALYMKTNQVQKAIPLFEKVTQLVPEKPDAYMAIGSIYEKIGRIDAAISTYQRLLKNNPNVYAAKQRLKELTGPPNATQKQGNLDIQPAD